MKAYTPPPARFLEQPAVQLSIADYGKVLAQGIKDSGERFIWYGLTTGKFGTISGGYHKPMGTYDLFLTQF